MNDKILWKDKPSKKVLIWQILFSCLITLIIVGIMFTAAIKDEQQFLILFFPFFALVIIFLTTTYFVFLYKSYEYTITNKGIYLNYGVIEKVQKFVPYYKITNVSTTRSIANQILGLGCINVQTAGTGGTPISEIVFIGLSDWVTPSKVIYKLIQ